MGRHRCRHQREWRTATHCSISTHSPARIRPAWAAPPPPPPVQIDDADRTRLGYFLSIPLAALDRPDGLSLVVSGILAAVAVLVPNRGLRLASFGFITVYGLNLLLGGVLLLERPFGTLIVPRYGIQYVPLSDW